MNSLKQVDAAHIPNKTKHLLDAKSRTLAESRLKDSFIISVVSLAPSKRVRPSMRERAASLTVALGATFVLTTDCSSTGSGFGARLRNPVPNYQSATNSEDERWYQPPRSPG